MSLTPNDPLYPQQWYIRNTGQYGGTPGIDLNLGGVWRDYTGKGVTVGVIDAGIEFNHPDLARNVNPAISLSATGVGDGQPQDDSDTHGDNVAGIIAGVTGNGIGIAGIAPDATLGSVYCGWDKPYPVSNNYAAGFELAVTAYDVVNNSWGVSNGFTSFNDPSDPHNAATGKAIADAASRGRNGLGSVIVFAAGNDRLTGDDANESNLNNSPFVVSVAAIDQNGRVTTYSTPGDCILVGGPSANIKYIWVDVDTELGEPEADGGDGGNLPDDPDVIGGGVDPGTLPGHSPEENAPVTENPTQTAFVPQTTGEGGENPAPSPPDGSNGIILPPGQIPVVDKVIGGVVTTTLVGKGQTAAVQPGGDYDYEFSGTSAAAPMVSAVAALILQANPRLGFRDVADILALTARNTDVTAQWAINGATTWNGGGMHVSHDVGYGMVDAHAAVRLAESWVQTPHTAANQAVSSGKAVVNQVIPNGYSGVMTSIPIAAPQIVERAEVILDLNHPVAKDLDIFLTSPSNTVSRLLNAGFDGAFPGTAFSLTSTHFFGESAAGTWILKVMDENGLDESGYLTGWSLNLYGREASDPLPYVFTNEYSASVKQNPARASLEDTSGQAVLNLTAMTGSSRVDLTPGSTSFLQGTPLTIAKDTVVKAVYTGDASNTLIGNGQNDLLYGGRGNDTFAARAGSDSIDGGAGSNTVLFQGKIDDYKFIFDAGKSIVLGPQSLTTIHDIQYLSFADRIMPFWGITFRAPSIYGLAPGSLTPLYPAVTAAGQSTVISANDMSLTAPAGCEDVLAAAATDSPLWIQDRLSALAIHNG